MGYVDVGTVRTENDLRVPLSANLRMSEQCATSALKDNKILRLIRRNIILKEEEIITSSSKSTDRFHPKNTDI